MKKVIAVTIGIFLTAGMASVVMADEWYYYGTATGDCPCDPDPFGPWWGYLRYNEPGYGDGFTGEWGNDEDDNGCSGSVNKVTQGGIDKYILEDGYWYQNGTQLDGTWDCVFVPSADTAQGTWDSEDIGCTGGTLWGNVIP